MLGLSTDRDEGVSGRSHRIHPRRVRLMRVASLGSAAGCATRELGGCGHRLKERADLFGERVGGVEVGGVVSADDGADQPNVGIEPGVHTRDERQSVGAMEQLHRGEDPTLGAISA